MPRIDEYVSAGIYDPAWEIAPGRLRILEWLSDQGFTIEQLVEAHDEDGLSRLASDRYLRGKVIDHDEALRLVGVDEQTWHRLWIAAGLGPTTSVSTSAAELFSVFASAREMFTPDAALHFLRVIGSSLSRIAEAANTLFLVDVEAPMVAQPHEPLELAQEMLRAVMLLDQLDKPMAQLLRLHLQAAILRSRDSRVNETESMSAPMAMGFVDLVGFTPLSRDVNPRELMRLVLDFEGRAYDIVAEHGGRVVKFIGDEVMFTTVDPIASATIVLEMFASIRERADVTPRGGLAYGYVLPHGGDYYGATVNLASRVADIAVPWEILVTAEFAALLGGKFAVTPAGRRMLKGFDDPIELHSLSMAEAAPACL